ncbi:hypothetical protein [Burkholderia ambifaria]|uniref:hypothetical protein n=1 Tax=Burkholderia ambifaria TaxID=152480 RepID=UPI00158D265D|nr:hypothetical protein [Burkholderia ambifaria]
MGTVWEYQWEYTDLDSGEVKLYPFFLTSAEAGHTPELIQFDGGRKLQHTRRERVGPPAWREAYKVEQRGIRPMPDFDSPLHAELVALYRRERNPDVRRVILEVVRARRVIVEIDELFRVVRAEYKDGLVAMYKLRCLLQKERWRVGGELGGAADARKPAHEGPQKDGPKPDQS